MLASGADRFVPVLIGDVDCGGIVLCLDVIEIGELTTGTGFDSAAPSTAAIGICIV